MSRVSRVLWIDNLLLILEILRFAFLYDVDSTKGQYSDGKN